jgi:hypothetical protein
VSSGKRLAAASAGAGAGSDDEADDGPVAPFSSRKREPERAQPAKRPAQKRARPIQAPAADNDALEAVQEEPVASSELAASSAPARRLGAASPSALPSAAGAKRASRRVFSARGAAAIIADASEQADADRLLMAETGRAPSAGAASVGGVVEAVGAMLGALVGKKR